MHRLISMMCALVLLAGGAFAQTVPSTMAASKASAKGTQKTLVEFEMMTWVEVKKAIHEQGKTTALIYTGGTEQRGPQNVNGGHNMMARETVRAIALRLGNAIAAPVLPFSPNNASAEMPGTIGLTAPLYSQITEEIAEQLIKSGFKNVVLMGDHGGGQKELKEVAEKLDRKYSSQAIRVVYCDEVYQRAQDD